MSKSTQNVLEIEINAEKCKNCQNIMPLDKIDEHHQGIVATYSDDQYCTLDCMGEAKQRAE